MQLTNHAKFLVTAAALLALLPLDVHAASFTTSTFAKGISVSSTSPDSIVYFDGSVWVSYQNGADSTGASGSSTVVRYSPTGGILNTWSIAGNVDGLRADLSGQILALQNNDGNSTLTLINPLTNVTTPVGFGATYTNQANRGFDDFQFANAVRFFSETNPASGSDPIIVQATTPLTTPVQISGILNSTFTGINLASGLSGSITITDPDSLVLDLSGNLVLTGEADQTLVFVHNAGLVTQSASFLHLLGIGTGLPDDTVFPNAPAGTFYISDTGANTVYSIFATGILPGSVYIDVGNEFGSLDLTTGNVTPIFTGVSPHGVTFVATPEPSSFFPAGGALLLCVALVFRTRARWGRRFRLPVARR